MRILSLIKITVNPGFVSGFQFFHQHRVHPVPSPGTYNLDFWLYYNDATGQEFKVVFDGVTVVDLTSQLNSGGGAYIHVVENGITATDLNPVLTFESQNFVNYMRLDDVNLVAAIPEPSSLSLAGFGALGFIANEIRRRYSSRIQA